ncbi:hypothetical protein JVU11DRAFT_10546 [Chiua virens]|nr:hypothetical protein JVU11DRAFT_10546 [Chiua virens]
MKNTLMYTLSSSVSWPIHSNDKTICQCLAVCNTIIQQCNFRHGLLIDFNYAKFLDQELLVSEGE